MKRIFTVLAVAALMVVVLLVMAAPAFAVAHPKANCEGVYSSGDNSFAAGTGGAHTRDRAEGTGLGESAPHCIT